MKNVIINENCITGLKKLESNSIDCCITSPPYFGLRDYGTDEQIGLEETPEQFVSALVEVFREVKRVLKDDGTLWLNLGDSYAGSGGAGNQFGQLDKGLAKYKQSGNPKYIGLKPKDLIGIPWRVAFALQADGWYLRQDIIWHKPNPMPESVTDRCTKAHEYIFLLSKSQRYYFDNESIKEDNADPLRKSYQSGSRSNGKNKDRNDNDLSERTKDWIPDGRNKRSVWTVTTKPYSGAHFATFPQDLIEPCIKAGCPIDGIVLDPFMGAGTTAVVARKLNRNYIGFELNAEYVKIAEQRITDELGFFV
jgi:DNA modification methylase